MIAQLIRVATPYAHLMRWHQPIGILLLGYPVMWALWLARGGLPDGHLLTIFVAGILCTRSAGCVMNDIADRHFDGQVKRTKQRPLAQGKLSLKQAVSLLLILFLCAVYLILHLNNLSRLIALSAFALTILYPFTKRWLCCPQLILGIAFSSGTLMAYAATLNHLPGVAWYLFGIVVLWAIIYDTQYAMVDRSYDKVIGLRSTAILFGHYDVLSIAVMQALMIGLLLGLAYCYDLKGYFYGACFLTSILFVYQISLIRKHDAQNCFIAFLNNQWVGLAICLGIMTNYI